MYRRIPFASPALFAALALSSAQAQFADDFSDGDFTADPAWDGSAAVFQVNDAQQLRSNDVVAATSQLRSANAMATLDDSEWRVRVTLGFAASSSNFARVYLVSDQADLTGPLNGYYLQFGEAGSADAIELFEQTGTTSASVCRGTEAQIAAAFDVGVQVKRNATGTWQLLVDPAGGTNYALQASGLGTAHTTSTTIGVLCTYTVSNATKFYFDDFFAGPQIVDTQAPTLLSATAIGPVDVDVRFSEPVEEVSAETATNYALAPAIGIASATRDGGDLALVHLSLATALTDGTNYTVTATGVQDVVGNVGTATNASFTYVVPQTAQPGDVVINEIMADPSPVVGLPDAEFVELFNTTTGQSFDLAGWTYSDGGTPVALPSVVLGPGNYVILCTSANTALFTSFGTVAGLSSLSLTNTGDPIELRDDGGTLIDGVTYALSWYHDAVKAAGGWTLERINPTAPCSGASNWTASIAAAGGTPGAQNSVFSNATDTQAPSIADLTVVSATELVLTFNEAMDQASLATGTYSIVPGIPVSSAVAVAVDQVRLTLGTPLQPSQLYAITVTNVSDCPGNAISITGNTWSFGLAEPAVAGDVLINEIMADPDPAVGLPAFEFVEVYNATTDKIIDLGGWTFGDGGTPATLPSTLLGPGAFAILCSIDNVAAFSSYGTTVGATGFPSLNNDGDPLELRDGGGTLIDAVTYALSWYRSGVKDDGGWTLERIDPTALCSGAFNWTASIAALGGTPGAQNSVYAIVPDTQAPSLIGAFVNSDTQVDLLFSEGMDQASLASGTYTIAPAIAVSSAAASAADRVRLTLSGPLQIGQTYTITVTNVADCPGNAIGAANSLIIGLPEPVAVGDVVINEVLYDPRGSGSDFVELYNRSQKILSLAGWKLANVDNGVIDNATVITDAAYLLMPGAYVAIAEDTANIAINYPLGHRDRYLQADMPSYNNGQGTVVLLAPDDDTLDLFNYNDALHFELLNETDGVSLERVDPARATSDNSNWHSAAEAVGWATPGHENSQYAPAVEARGAITIEPAIFSPDNDGYQDLLTISYRFEEPGFVGTMKVFDIAGREVRTLMDNELLGTSGAVSWDGIMDTKDLARIGPYVVYFEAYDLNGNVEKFRGTVVLAHRL